MLLDLPSVDIARARQTLDHRAPPTSRSPRIWLPVNAPVAEVRRVLPAIADGTVIYLGEVTYRGDYIHLEMDLKP